MNKVSKKKLEDNLVNCGRYLFLQGDAGHDLMKMCRIKDIICDKMPLVAGIHQPHSRYFPASKLKKIFSPYYLIGYDKNTTEKDNCQSVILIRKMCVGDYINVTPQYNSSFSETILKTQDDTDIIAVCYTSSIQQSANYHDDIANLRGALKSRVDPLVAFLSFKQVKADEIPEFIKNPTDFFQNDCQLIPIMSKGESQADAAELKYFLFVNLWMKEKFVFAEIYVDESENSYIKIVKKKRLKI